MSTPTSPALITPVTIFSFATVALILLGSYFLSLLHLPYGFSRKLRLIYIWHIFDALIHLILEASFVFYSLTSHAATAPSNSQTLWASKTHSYGTKYATAPLGKLWQEYSLADFRWGKADIGVLSVEIITVVFTGPLAVYICMLLAREQERKAWWWICVLATAEIYGGWMTFAPEWLSGSLNLETSVPMYKWVYLLFFNGLWVVIPGWLMWESYQVLTNAKRKVK